MAKHKKEPPKKPKEELDDGERELFLNAFYQGGFLAEECTQVSVKEVRSEGASIAEDERTLFLQAVSSSDLRIPKKDRAIIIHDDDAKQSRKKALVDGKIDLHGMFAEDAVNALFKFLDQEKRRGSRTVLIVHGKGSGVLKNAVWSCLDSHPLVFDFQIAPGRLGGAGAILARINRKARK